jgi:hypothetical protein
MFLLYAPNRATSRFQIAKDFACFLADEDGIVRGWMSDIPQQLEYDVE